MEHEGEGMIERGKHRVGDMMEGGKEQIASRVDQASERLEERGRSMEQQGGLKGQTGKVVHKTGEALGSGAEYLQTHGMGSIADDITRQLREHPYLSVGIAFGTGMLLGRLFSGGEDEEEEHRRRYRQRRQHRENRLMETLKKPAGRALVGGVTAYAARQIRRRVAGR